MSFLKLEPLPILIDFKITQNQPLILGTLKRPKAETEPFVVLSPSETHSQNGNGREYLDDSKTPPISTIENRKSASTSVGYREKDFRRRAVSSSESGLQLNTADNVRSISNLRRSGEWVGECGVFSTFFVRYDFEFGFR